MKNPNKYTTAVLLLLLPLTASGVTLATIDFDANAPTYSYGYAFAGQGNPFVSNDAQTSNVPGIVGNTGSGISVDANFTTTNNTGMDYNYGGFGLGFNAPVAVAPPSALLTDYTVNFDVMVMGFTPGLTTVNGNYEVSFKGPGGFNIKIQSPITLSTSGWQTFSLTIPASSVSVGDAATFAANFATTTSIDFQVNATNAIGFAVTEPREFGFDSGNIIAIDNFTMTAVPEPSTSVLGLLTAGFVLARRNRRA